MHDLSQASLATGIFQVTLQMVRRNLYLATSEVDQKRGGFFSSEPFLRVEFQLVSSAKTEEGGGKGKEREKGRRRERSAENEFARCLK